MALDIVVPPLGESITEAVVASWLKNPGQSLIAGEPVVELSTVKANAEVRAPTAGVLLAQLAAVGDKVKVGAVIGTMGR